MLRDARTAREPLVATEHGEFATAWSSLGVAAASARGRHHRVNEDAHSPLDGGAPVFVVADGVGGGAMAAWTSRSLVTEVHRSLARDGVDADAVRLALLEADREIAQRIADRGAASGAATAVVCVATGALRASWIVAWVGDCRVYRVVKGAGPQLLTRDDTYGNLGEQPPPGGSPDDPARMIGNGAVSAAQRRAHHARLGRDAGAPERRRAQARPFGRDGADDGRGHAARVPLPQAHRSGTQQRQRGRRHGAGDPPPVAAACAHVASRRGPGRDAGRGGALRDLVGSCRGRGVIRVIASRRHAQRRVRDDPRRDRSRVRPRSPADGDRQARRGVPRGLGGRCATTLHQALPAHGGGRLRPVDRAGVAHPRAADRARHRLRAGSRAVRPRRAGRHAARADLRRRRDGRPVGHDPAGHAARAHVAARVRGLRALVGARAPLPARAAGHPRAVGGAPRHQGRQRLHPGRPGRVRSARRGPAPATRASRISR